MESFIRCYTRKTTPLPTSSLTATSIMVLRKSTTTKKPKATYVERKSSPQFSFRSGLSRKLLPTRCPTSLQSNPKGAQKTLSPPRKSQSSRYGALLYLRINHSIDCFHLLVKKNVQTKKEKLGPHWSAWVNKAVGKLVSPDRVIIPSRTDAGHRKTKEYLSPLRLQAVWLSPPMGSERQCHRLHYH